MRCRHTIRPGVRRDAYLVATGIVGQDKQPLFRSWQHGVLTNRRMTRTDALRMIKRRANAADMPASSHTFGPEMREDLRRRYQQRRSQGEQLFDCTDEHLEGIAYSLTSQCKVQWSIDRPWEETGSFQFQSFTSLTRSFNSSR